LTADGPQPPSPRHDPDRESANWWGLAGMGLEFCVTIGALALLGWYLDRRWNTGPWLLVAGVAVGFGVGLMTLVRAGAKAFKDR